MSDVGQGQCQEKFFMVGWSVGWRVVDGEGHCQTADGRKFLLLFRTAPNFLLLVVRSKSVPDNLILLFFDISRDDFLSCNVVKVKLTKSKNIKFHPHAREASREVANSFERKKLCTVSKICLSVCLSVTNFDLYLYMPPVSPVFHMVESVKLPFHSKIWQK